MRPRAFLAKLEELAVGAVRSRNFSLVAGAVGDGPDQTSSSIAQVRPQCVEPAVYRHSVVVEEDNDVAAGQRRTPIGRGGKSEIVWRELHPNPLVVPAQIEQIRPGAVRRVVIHNDHFELDGRCSGKQILQAQS